MERNYFLDLQSAVEYCRKEHGRIRIHSHLLGPQETFNVKQIKKDTNALAIIIYRDEKNYINSRFEILDLESRK